MKADAAKHLSHHDFTQVLNIDTQLDPGEISFESVREISTLEPFGMGNPTPLFMIPGVQITSVKTMGSTESHLSFNIVHGNRMMRAVAFGFGEHREALSKQQLFDLALQLKIDEWNGEKRLQAVIKDMRYSW